MLCSIPELTLPSTFTSESVQQLNSQQRDPVINKKSARESIISLADFIFWNHLADLQSNSRSIHQGKQGFHDVDTDNMRGPVQDQLYVELSVFSR